MNTSQPARSSAARAASPPRANSATDRPRLPPSAPASGSPRPEAPAARALSKRMGVTEPVRPGPASSDSATPNRRDPPAAGRSARAPSRGRILEEVDELETRARRPTSQPTRAHPRCRRRRAPTVRRALPSACSTSARPPRFRSVRSWSIRFAAIRRSNGSRGRSHASIVACNRPLIDVRGVPVARSELSLEGSEKTHAVAASFVAEVVDEPREAVDRT